MKGINHTILKDKDINSCFSVSQRPFQYALQTNIKIDQKKINNVAIILTKHFIFGLDGDDSSNKKNRKIFDIHISKISQIEKKSDKCIYIGNSQDFPLLIIYSIDKKVTKLIQLLYRNIVLSYYNKDKLELNWDDNSQFPPIDIRYLSPSQIFQFNYFAYCTFYTKKYNHDFVRYIHNLIIEDSPIIDFSVLSPRYFRKRINSLKCAKDIFRGICLRDFPYPDLIKGFSQLITEFPNIKIVSFSNCNCNKGLTALADASKEARKRKKSFGVTYWDLSFNKFNNFSYFSTVIENSTEPIKYLNINGCNIYDEDAEILFSTLEHFEHVKKLKFLSIAETSFDSNKSIRAFKRFLQVCNLTYLDLGSIPNIADVITSLEEVGVNSLKTLILKNTLLESRSLDDLLQIIKHSDKLAELDISGTGLLVESISSIIETINDNKKIKKFSLKLDSLDLHGKSLKAVIKAFLNNEYSDNDGSSSPRSKKRSQKQSNKKSPLKKWKSLSFASNQMTNDDLSKIIQFLNQMDNLEIIYLDDNFDSSMEGISETLCDLLHLDIPLTGISLAGSKHHILGEKLIPFLEEAAKSETLEYLNIENNNLGNGAVQVIKNLLVNSKTLKTLKIDNNSFTSIPKIKSIIDAAEVCQTLTTFGFPLFDSSLLCTNDEDGKAERKLLQLQSQANYIISQHRREKRAELIQQNAANGDDNEDDDYYQLKCQMPFEVENEDVERLLASIINNYPKVSPNKRTYHSLACEIFDLPFPFQQSDERASDCELDVFRQDKSEDMKVYDKTETLIGYIKEPTRQFSYADKSSKINYLLTYGPTVSNILDDEHIKRPKHLSNQEAAGKARKRKSFVQFPSNIKSKSEKQPIQYDDKNSHPLKTRVVDSRNLDNLVDMDLENNKKSRSKNKAKRLDMTQKRNALYDNENRNWIEENNRFMLRKTQPANLKRNIFDEYSEDNDEENSTSTADQNKWKKQRPVHNNKNKLKLRADDDSYSNSNGEEEDGELIKPQKKAKRNQISIRQDQDSSSDIPSNNPKRKQVLPDYNDTDTDDENENERKGWKNQNSPSKQKHDTNQSQSQSQSQTGNDLTTSSTDDENAPFLKQRPTSKVIPVSSDSYIINRNRNNSNNEDEENESSNRNRSPSSKRVRKSSAAYDPSSSTDNSPRNSDDDNDDQNQDQQEQYNDGDMFKVSPLPKPPHLKSTQSALAFAYNLMILDDQSDEQKNDDEKAEYSDK